MTTQADLFISARTELDRCRGRMGEAIALFFRSRVGEFRAEDLRVYVEARVGPTAPGSVDRVMRALRQSRAIRYELVSRRDSLYRVLP